MNRNIFKEHSIWVGLAAGAVIGLSLAQDAWAWATPWAVLAWAAAMSSARTQRVQAACLFTGLAAWTWFGGAWITAAVRPDSPARGLWQAVTWLALLGHRGLCVMTAWWLAQQALLQRTPGPVAATLAWAIALVSGEAWAQVGWLGHGYLGLGQALATWPPATPLLPWIGGLGVAALCTLLAAGWVLAWHGVRRTPRRRLVVLAAGLTLSAAAVPAWSTHPEDPGTAPVQVVALVSDLRFDGARAEALRDRQVASLQAAMALAGPGGLVVTPETFFAEPPPAQAHGTWAELLAGVRDTGATVLLGMPHALRDAGGAHLFNAAVQLSPTRSALYGKQRLVPFGEFLPWPERFGAVYAQLFESARDGQHPAPAELAEPLYLAGHPVGVLICHEMSLPLEAARRAIDSDWLVVLAEDSWIPDPAYRAQMASLARLRALETGRPLLRVANGGPSLSVSAGGHATALTAPPEDGLAPVRAQLAPTRQPSPYARSAEAQWWGWALWPVWAWWPRPRRRTNEERLPA